MHSNYLMPASVLLQIAAIPPPREELGCDRLYWGPSSTGKFSTRSAYDFLDDVGGSVPGPGPLWRAVWQWPGLQRIRNFLWLLAKNRLLTNVERMRRHLTPEACYELCRQADESTVHVCWDCPLAAEIWRHLLPRSVHIEFFSLSLEEWLFSNLVNPVKFGDANWTQTFGVVVWKIWGWRNEHLFQGK
ncbi:Polynucleotidyl transferase- ribonuclease H-like superfamily protein [Striga hermonthica]|uniref:Polynucleotidyl transferase- ribonuclease H-like superfamily protein n=1 Tax=Striga hermonthica TaxID=68872 RepID=A0A9N7NI59_STRHE|nr:Polynucleotidyl transferase- ribonuclease H-like superfamily protein [Striga hermonthica]